VGSPRLIAALVAKGADVNPRDTNGRTPLYMAVQYKDEHSVQALLDAGANPDIPDKDGQTVLMLVETSPQSLMLFDRQSGDTRPSTPDSLAKKAKLATQMNLGREPIEIRIAEM